MTIKIANRTVSAIAGTTLGIVLFTAISAGAATLGLNTNTPSLAASNAVVDYLEFAPDGDLSTFGAVIDVMDGLSLNGFAEIGFGVGFALSDPTGDASGGFDVTGEDGTYLAGELLAVGFGMDAIELQFGNLGGAGASAFGASVLATIVFADPLGPDPFDAFTDGTPYDATITIASVAPIPLPGGIALLITGLGCMAVMRRGNHRI